MKKRAIQWLHWFLYGEWKVDIRPNRIFKQEKFTETEMVATPFIATGYITVH